MQPAPVLPSTRGLDISSEPRVLVVYLRPSGRFDRLDAAVSMLAMRHVREVRVEIVRPEATATNLGPLTSRRTPCILIYRAGELVGEAFGELPLRELEELVGAARRATCYQAQAAA